MTSIRRNMTYWVWDHWIALAVGPIIAVAFVDAMLVVGVLHTAACR